MSAESRRVVRLGNICGVYGVRGWVKVRSDTEPRVNILDYPRWWLDTGGRLRPLAVEHGRLAGKNLIAKLAGVDDRDAAQELIGATISVPRSELPPCAPDEVYWVDLEGLEVRSVAGESFGRVLRLFRTGANDVLVLDGPGERLIPCLPGQVIQRVDVDGGFIVVDWDARFWE